MIFHDDDDRESFLGILAGVVALFNWRIHAWVLMGNHYHILLSTPEPTLHVDRLLLHHSASDLRAEPNNEGVALYPKLLPFISGAKNAGIEADQ